MVYLPKFLNFEDIVRICELRKNNHPNRVINIVTAHNEPPKMSIDTIASSIMANWHCQDIGVSVPLSRVILSDQSTEDNARINYKEFERRVLELKEKFEKDGKSDYFPEVGYFRVGGEMGNDVLSKWKDIHELDNFLKRVKEKGKPFGKGGNVWANILAQGFLERDLSQKNNRKSLDSFDFLNSALLITDNDSDDISWRQIAVQGLCLGYLDADAEVAAFTRYHRTPDGGTERGGRVNASMGGLLDMLSNQRLCDEFGYGFSGDQGGKLKLFQDFCCPEHYGIEVSMRIQFHSMINGFDSNKIKVDRDKLYQPEIGGSDDQAIGEGKPKEDALKGIIDMSQQIAGSFLATIGYENLRNYWDSPEKFMQDFKLRQIVRMEAWRRASRNDYNTVLPISGGIEDQELRDITYEATNRIVKRFYSDENYRAELLEEFLPSPNNLITSIGPNKYFELGKDLSQHYHVIAV